MSILSLFSLPFSNDAFNEKPTSSAFGTLYINVRKNEHQRYPNPLVRHTISLPTGAYKASPEELEERRWNPLVIIANSIRSTRLHMMERNAQHLRA